MLSALVCVILGYYVDPVPPDYIKVFLSFDRRSYRMNEPIDALITVRNAGDRPFKFKICSKTYKTFFFTVRTPKNQALPLKPKFSIEVERAVVNPDDVRVIELLPGESFSREVDISKWFDFRNAGYYIVSAVFSPDLRADEMSGVRASRFKLLVKPPVEVERRIKKEQIERVEELEKAVKSPPYEGVAHMLNARKVKDWEAFFVHLDLEKLLNAFPRFKSAYESAPTGEARIKVLKSFEDYLKTYWSDRIEDFSVFKSVIERDKAVVMCDVVYRYRRLRYKIRYTYYLYKTYDGRWLVYDYTALNLK